MTGLPGYPVRGVRLDGLRLGMAGGQREGRGLDVPEAETAYPEGHMFGVLPGYGFYARHVENLSLREVDTRWESSDVRPAMVFDDVKDLSVDGFRAETLAPDGAAVWLNNVFGALLRGSRVVQVRNFVRVSGAASGGIVVSGNDFSRVEEPVEFVGVPRSSVTMSGNAGR